MIKKWQVQNEKSLHTKPSALWRFQVYPSSIPEPWSAVAQNIEGSPPVLPKAIIKIKQNMFCNSKTWQVLWRRTPDSPFHSVVICVTRTDGQQSLLIVPWCEILKRSKYKVFETQCHKKKHNSSELYSETPWAISTSKIVYVSILM